MLVFAVTLLRRKGRFFPFGAVLRPDGLQIVAAPPDAASSGDAGGLLDALVAELRALAADEGEGVRGAGTCVDIRGGRGEQLTMRADAELRAGGAVIAEVAYERRFPRRFRLDPAPSFRPGLKRFW